MANEEHLAMLKRGVEDWNEWRNKYPDIIPDLSEEDLTGQSLIAINFSGANLHKVILFQTKLVSANFNKADLSEAILDEAILVAANLSEANLTKAHFYKTCLRGADLTKANLKEATFREADFRDRISSKTGKVLTNLSGADLTKADFCRTSLFDTNLSRANLSEANLSEAQALSTNFEGATLTGACIKHWNINSETNLENVICDYIYLKYNQQERRPHDHNKNFAPGDFFKLVQKALNTVDLIFSDGINWQAFLTSFQQLQSKCGSDELAIQAIEKKSSGAFVIRVEVPLDTNKAEVEKYLKREYKIQLKAIEDRYRLKLKAKDNEIEIYKQQSTDLLELAKLAASRPINISQIQGNNMDGDRYTVTGNDNQVVQGQNIRATQKNQTNKNNEEELTPAQVVELLAELEEKIQQSTLPENVKDKTLKSLGASSVEAQEQEPDKQLFAGNLKRATENLSQARQATEEGKKLWDEVFPILKTVGKWGGVAVSFFSQFL
jgi:uncharacterized protein YjbI with pentapeptide repeats